VITDRSITFNLAFVVLRVLELCLALVFPLAPSACLGLTYALDPLHERLRPPAPLEPGTDLREFYPASKQ
jgi:hypothetical protein